MNDTRTGRLLLACGLGLAVGACRPAGGSGAESSHTAAVTHGAAAEAKALLDQGQFDAALTKLQEGPADADNLYLQGAVWAKKAETAPLPTPPPILPGSKEAPRAAEFKAEELKALESFEGATAIRIDHPQANLAIAELLAPHAIRRWDVEEGSRAAAGRRRGKGVAVAPAHPQGGPDTSPERVMKAYQMACQGDLAAKGPAEAWLSFAQRVGRVEGVDAAFQELLKRDKENPEPIVRYGDFLLKQRKDAPGAVTQYRQALIWRADDDATRAKIAEIYIAMGVESYAKQQYAVAQTHFLEAMKYVTDKKSDQARKIQDNLGRLGEIRPGDRRR